MFGLKSHTQTIVIVPKYKKCMQTGDDTAQKQNLGGIQCKFFLACDSQMSRQSLADRNRV